jgi:hypothetical protein
MTLRRTHLLPVSLLLATGCFDPGDHPEEQTSFDTATGSNETDPTGDSQPGETDPDDPSEESGGVESADSGDETDGAETETDGTESETAGETESETGNDTDPDVDATAPTVVSVSPEDGVHGVANDAQVVIMFSEPMNRAATQAAWQSADIGGATFSWNDDDSELTIVPNVALAYAAGPDPDAIEYAFTLATTATDAAGNELETAFASSFFTLRRIEIDLAPIDALTGLVSSNSINPAGVHAGDTQYDLQQVSMLSFALPNLPSGAQLTRASVHVDQTVVGGSPYGVLPGLGEVHLLDVEFETQFDAPDAVALADLGIFSDDAALETKTHDVTDAVLDDYSADLSTTQFRIEFPVATNGNAILDRCTFAKPTMGMALSYLVE